MPTPSKPARRRGSPPKLSVSASADRLELMQTFIRIVDAGSLSSAAAQLGTTQPTVSRRLQALERSLGLRLLQRSTHAMKLTEDGTRCYERAKELLASWDMFESDLRGASDEPEGRLRVVVPHAFGQELLVAPLTEYLGRYPRVSVEWLLHDRPVDFIADGIDCAIHVGEVQDPSVVASRVAEVPRIVVAAPSVLAGGPVPEHPDALARLPWLSLRTFYRNEIALTHVATGEVQPIVFQPRVSTDSLYALRSAAVKGLGVCVGSSWVLQEDLQRGRLLHLVPRWQAAPLPMFLIYPAARFHPARLRRFVEWMRERIPAALAVATRRG
ncbi:LysR family transcriptional regulator [Corallococcus coralloides DSM 2259]|uniref:LysR family transcriptional regulator n=1 Tax=Corallococcus coralloides (strain ATCC 25202 / DSM 2259 / NBRC 100086 / M2) TaxID=1144275 RepID=H8MF29_CORCM|nr:LysR family transcriptional regulator [Corallococcus coralloides]AFE11012.1 LysR family transcriptional regulator [Corallococcus coralloides DSM 2259]